MIYIDAEPNESGAYPNPKMQPFDGCITLNDSQEKTFFQYNGFIQVISTDPVEIQPNLEAWEAWKAWKAQQPDVPANPKPTMDERVTALEDALLAVMMGGGAGV